MGLSVGSMRPISSVSYVVKSPQMYAVDNESSVSSAYTESVRDTAAAGNGIGVVDGARPTQYANAKTTSVSPMQETQRMGRAYNEIAEAFAGITTSYAEDMSGMQYDYIGSNIDVYA